MLLPVADEPRVDETAVETDVAMIEASEERPAEAEQEVVTEVNPLAIVQVPLDIASPSGTITALVTLGALIPRPVTIPISAVIVPQTPTTCCRGC